jgi:hypothetical protein
MHWCFSGLVHIHHIIPLCYDTGNALTLIAIRLSRTTAILRLLAATGDIVGCLQEILPPPLTLLGLDERPKLLVHEKLGAAHAHTAQDVQDHGQELDVVDWAAETVVSKVSRAIIVGLAARTALLAILQNAHTRIKQASDLGFRALIGGI